MKVVLPNSAKIDGNGELVLPGTEMEMPHEEAALLKKIGTARDVVEAAVRPEAMAEADQGEPQDQAVVE